jgi:hypothetical protein
MILFYTLVIFGLVGATIYVDNYIDNKINEDRS